MGLIAAQNDGVFADPLQVVELQLLRDQDIADPLLLLVHAESDAHQEHRARSQRFDAFLHGLLRGAQPARAHFGQRQKHPRIAHRAEVAVGAAILGHNTGGLTGHLGEDVEDRFALDFGGGDDQDIGGRDIGGWNHRVASPCCVVVWPRARPFNRIVEWALDSPPEPTSPGARQRKKRCWVGR